MTFFKPPGSRSDVDAAAFFGSAAQQTETSATDPYFTGQQAYWSVLPRRCPLPLADVTATDKWLAGYDAACLEAARTLRQSRALIANAKTVRDTLTEAGLVIRRVREQWTKAPHGLRGQLAEALKNVNGALLLIPAIKPDPNTGPEGNAAPGA